MKNSNFIFRSLFKKVKHFLIFSWKILIFITIDNESRIDEIFIWKYVFIKLLHFERVLSIFISQYYRHNQLCLIIFKFCQHFFHFLSIFNSSLCCSLPFFLSSSVSYLFTWSNYIIRSSLSNYVVVVLTAYLQSYWSIITFSFPFS